MTDLPIVPNSTRALAATVPISGDRLRPGPDPGWTPETLENMALAHFVERKTWTEIAKELGKDRKTISNWRRNNPAWKEAVAAVVANMKAEAVPTAYAALLRAAEQNNDLAAAKALLDRVEGPVGSQGDQGQPQEIVFRFTVVPARRWQGTELDPRVDLSAIQPGRGSSEQTEDEGDG